MRCINKKEKEDRHVSEGYSYRMNLIKEDLINYRSTCYYCQALEIAYECEKYEDIALGKYWPLGSTYLKSEKTELNRFNQIFDE